jgi:FKBP-type peptidyl-prolyl cis-trans isomerase
LRTHGWIDSSQVIKGWDIGVMQMSLGEKAKLVVSPRYGPDILGLGPPLTYWVELVAINDSITKF